MKIKSLNNQGAIIGSTIVYTLVLLIFFGAMAFSFNSLLWLIPFLIGFKVLLFLMLRNLKGVIFYTDKMEVAKYGLSDQKMIFQINQVQLERIKARSMKSAKVPIAVFIGEKRLGVYLLKNTEEFEAFQMKTTVVGYNWKGSLLP